MSTTTKKKVPQGIRYSDAQKKEIVDFVLSTNAAKGRGGVSVASKKFKVSPITVNSWLKAAGTSPSKAATPAPAAKAAPAAKQKSGKAKTSVGTRYTPEQKKEVVDFVASYNAANGRGGQSAAAAKFAISPLTVMAWLKASGAPKAAKKGGKKATKKVKPAAAAKAAPAAAPAKGDVGAKLATLLELSKQINKAEGELAQLKAKFASLKASL